MTIIVIIGIVLVLCMVAGIGCRLQKEYTAYAVARSYGTIAGLLTAMAIIVRLSGPEESAVTDMNGLLLLAVGFLVLFGAFYGIGELRGHHTTKP